MRVLYIHQYFASPKDPGGTRSYWLAKKLIEQGHEVTMVTTNKTQAEKIRYYDVDDIHVVSFSVPYSQSMGLFDRFLSYFKFSFVSFWYALKNNKRFELIFATSTPLTVGIPVLLLKWIKGKKFIFEVRDLWPEVPIQMDAIRNPIIIKVARWFEKTIYRNAEHVIALSPGMLDGVLKYIPVDKASMIPNMSKIDEFFPREKDYKLIDKLGLDRNSFKIIHFGSLGLANGADSIIETAKLMKNDSTVEFIFLGGGSTENSLKEMCSKYELSNVIFLPRTPMKETSEIVNICDVSIVSFKDLPILYTNSPNKLFDSLSAGKPIIVNSAGWTKDMVNDNRCGKYVNPNNPSELMSEIKQLQENPELVEDMGRNSRLLAERKFDKSILCNQFAEIINSYEK